jgi:hypothetical protein
MSLEVGLEWFSFLFVFGTFSFSASFSQRCVKIRQNLNFRLLKAYREAEPVKTALV